MSIDFSFKEKQYTNLEDYLSNRKLNSIEILTIIKRVANILKKEGV